MDGPVGRTLEFEKVLAIPVEGSMPVNGELVGDEPAGNRHGIARIENEQRDLRLSRLRREVTHRGRVGVEGDEAGRRAH